MACGVHESLCLLKLMKKLLNIVTLSQCSRWTVAGRVRYFTLQLIICPLDGQNPMFLCIWTTQGLLNDHPHKSAHQFSLTYTSSGVVCRLVTLQVRQERASLSCQTQLQIQVSAESVHFRCHVQIVRVLTLKALFTWIFSNHPNHFSVSLSR